MKNKGGDYSRYVKEVRTSNTPSSRDSIEFELKPVLKKRLIEWKWMKGRENKKREVKERRSLKRPDGRETRLFKLIS